MPNLWYQMEEGSRDNFIKELGGKRFLLWFLLNKKSVEMKMSDLVPIQIRQLVSELKGVRGFSKAVEIRKILLALKKVGLIESETLTEATKPSDLIYVNVNTEKYREEYSKGFSVINTKIFDDKIRKIDTTGFYIFCFLFKHHNLEYGDDYGFNGYAQIKRDFIGTILGIDSEKTITKYIKKLQRANHLIKKLKQEEYYVENEFGETVKKWRPNRYIVKPKCNPENKYNIKFEN